MTSDKQRSEAFVRRGVRRDLYGEGMTLLLLSSLRTLTKVHSRESCAAKITQFFPADVNNYRYSLPPRRHYFYLATKSQNRYYGRPMYNRAGHYIFVLWF